MPTVSTAAMGLLLQKFSKTLNEDMPAVMVLDQAARHGANSLFVPDNITLVPLPPYSPELNPVERVWLFLRERFPSFRLFADQTAIINACCHAWNALTADTGRIPSLPSAVAHADQFMITVV